MRLVLPSKPEAVTRAVRFAESVAAEAGFPEELADRLLLVVGEAVANSIEHGNGSEQSRNVTLEWLKQGRGGWLAVEDEGPGISLERLKNAHLPENMFQTGGRGLYIIRELADDVKVEAEGRRLMLWFRPRPEGST